jgi:hypothetical protein
MVRISGRRVYAPKLTHLPRTSAAFDGARDAVMTLPPPATSAPVPLIVPGWHDSGPTRPGPWLLVTCETPRAHQVA